MTLGELLKKFSTLSGRYQSFKNFAFGLANALQLYNSTRYFRHRRVVPTGHDIVSQRCTRHRLPPPPCNDDYIMHCIHRYFRNAVLMLHPDRN